MLTDKGFELRGETTPLRLLIRDVVQSRTLLRMLARRDFYVRYRRPSFGMAWAVGLPLINAAVLAVVFTRIVRIQTGVPYAAFIITGVLPWTFFIASLTAATSSISDGGALATKVYFPRAILPSIAVLANLYGFLPGVVVVTTIVAILRVDLWPHILLVPGAVLLAVLLALSLGLVLSALNVYFRDVSFVLQATTTAWFYGSSVIFPIDLVPEGVLRTAVQLNPATGMVLAFRAAVIGPQHVPLAPIWVTGAWIAVLLVAAALLHRRLDRVFADLM